MKKLTLLLIVAFMLLSCSTSDERQQPNPVHRKSPIAITSVTHKPTHTYVKIVYGQPYKRGRQIFGNLVPYSEVWRTGANEATELTTTRPINFNGKRVERGTYALFTIPRPKRWTIILNDKLGQWGAFEYNSEYDYLRTDVMAENISQPVEAFTIQFAQIQGDSTSIIMQWDTTRISIPISFIAEDTTSDSG